MSDELTYDVAKANASECYNRFGFLLGGRAVRLDDEPTPTSPEPMRTQRRAVRLSPPLDRESNPTPGTVQKAKTLSLDNIDLRDLERWLSGDESEPAAEPEPEPPAYVPVVELDRRPTFVDVVVAAHGGQDVRQAEPEHSFVRFLVDHYKEQRDGLKREIDSHK